jgi:dolichol kinase
MSQATPREGTASLLVSADVKPRTPFDVALKLPGGTALARRLGMPEFRRRLLHMLPGLLPFVLWVYPHDRLWELPVRVWVVGLTVLLAYFGIKHFNAMLREGERGSESILAYAISVLASLAIAPENPEFTLIVLVILAFGDGSATLGGMLIGGPKLPWNRDKTWAGMLSFWIVGTLMATIVYHGELADVTWRNAALFGAGVAACAAVAESLPLRFNDNFRVGIATLIGCFLIANHDHRPLLMVSVASVAAFLIQRKWRPAA